MIDIFRDTEVPAGKPNGFPAITEDKSDYTYS